MTDTLRRLIDTSLAAVSAKDLERALAAYTDDAVLIDPHYPVPRMSGHAEIAAGLSWTFRTMRELSFAVDRYCFAADRLSAAVEVTSDHVLAIGRPVHLQQVFVIEIRDGLIARWQAYEPYGPHGLAGLARRIGAIGHRRRVAALAQRVRPAAAGR